MNADLITQARIADDIEAAAYRDMYSIAPVELVRALNLRSMEVAGATLLMASGVPDPVFSRVIGLGNNGNSSDEQLDNVASAYRNAQIGSYWVHVNPVVAPRELALKLEQRGFQIPKRRTWAKMIRGTDAITPTSAHTVVQADTTLDTRPADSSEHAAVSQCIATAFSMPPLFAQWIQNMAASAKWTLVTARVDTRIVGGGLLFIENRVAWLGLGGVIPDARGRHAHRAIMRERIAIALAHGCTHIVTETGEPVNNEPNPSLRNMYRCGFVRVCSRLNYASVL